MADNPMQFKDPEQSAMIVASQMALYLDTIQSSQSIPTEVITTDAIRERLLAEYQTCYQALMAIHKQKPKAGTWGTESTVPPSGGKRTLR